MNFTVETPIHSSQPICNSGIAAIIPTIGRVDSLDALLHSLAVQSHPPDEVIISDASGTDDIVNFLNAMDWSARGLRIQRISVFPPNAVRQRRAAIAATRRQYILLLDDDVVLEQQCIRQLFATIDDSPDVVAVMCDFNNQTWSQPTLLWRLYLRFCHGIGYGEWQGRVIGPLLRFGYFPQPKTPVPMEWFGSGNSLLRRSAYHEAGGFSSFFLHRCTINEDVDLSLKVGRLGRIVLCPTARLAHMHAPTGRVSPETAAEDDLFNRFQILRHTQHLSAPYSYFLVATYFLIETASNLAGFIKRRKCPGFIERLRGRLRALRFILTHRAFADKLPS